MKKCHLAPLASLLLALSLVACGGSGNQEPTQPAAEETEASAQSTDETTADDSKATDEAADKVADAIAKDEEEADTTETPAPTEEPADDAPAEEEEEDSFQRGVIDGDTYRNEFFGITFTLPEDHQFATDEELAQVASVTQDMLENEAVLEALDSGRVIYDMYEYGYDGQNTNIAIEKVNAMAGALISEDKYREVCLSKIDEQLAGTGMELVEHAETTQMVGSTEHPAVTLTLTYEDRTIYEKLVFIKGGSYFALVTSAAPTAEDADALMAHLSEI